ncbi:MAG: AMP-binding protein [Ahrensia sp.]|nr:AMP-binding protein [Ahrensia sp.]
MDLTERLDRWAEHAGDETAIVFEGSSISFTDLRDRSRVTAAILHHHFKVMVGDRVAYLGLNQPAMIEMVFACAKLGAIFTPFNTRLARDEYAYLLSDSEPTVCFFAPEFAATIADLDSALCTFAPTGDLEASIDLPDVEAQRDISAPLLLVYTSGTTGRPKGVVLPQSAVLATIENGHELYQFAPGQKVLITLPLFHVGGLCILLLPALVHGATVHLHARFDPQATVDALEQDGITSTILVPAQMAAMMALNEWQTSQFPALTHIVVGSSIIPMHQIRAWHDRGVPVSQIYGATETGPSAIGLPLADSRCKEGSAGIALRHCAIEVRDGDGTPCADGENGEIWVRGDNVMSHYWRNPQQTAQVLVDGWYNTGDIGHRDADGFFWIVDRSKDVIISGGENIYPAEVEAVALQHPAIAAIAVVGKPDPHWGETPVAAVETKPGTMLTEVDFTRFFEDKLARYKQPKSLLVFDQLPRNAMGKIDKVALRKHVAGKGPD